jgi:hypothetical protein
MNPDKTYAQWTHQRRQVPVPENFVRRVMAEIEHQTPARCLCFFECDAAQPHLLARWGAALGLIAVGLFRIVFVTANLLIGGTL